MFEIQSKKKIKIKCKKYASMTLLWSYRLVHLFQFMYLSSLQITRQTKN